MDLTVAQQNALAIIVNNGGEGVFDKKDRLLVRGEVYAFEASTINALRKAGAICDSGVRRIRVTDIGHVLLEAAMKKRPGMSRTHPDLAGRIGTSMIPRMPGAE